MNDYDKISKGICVKCGGSMKSSNISENNGFNFYCKCGYHYKFIDDMGPGSYIIRKIKEKKEKNDQIL